ncbi:DUF6526 family protein [Pedobacter sp. GR22-6]|uniref:DUF6526 family protein n=1 Tax=Pedobacter sp. GR22-6 TaxID=3127957 RepID=UPI00307ED27A
MQNYKNHLRFYTPHHFIFYPILLILIAFAVYWSFVDRANHFLWIFMAVILFLVGWLSYMLRQHYALTLQNRIVVLEMRLRYHVLTAERLELLEERLSFSQIAALRFAPDEELPALLQRALKEGLSPDEIKKAIQNWLPDHNRV